MYIGTNVLMYERWLMLKVWYTASRPTQHFRHSILTLLMHVSQKLTQSDVRVCKNDGPKDL